MRVAKFVQSPRASSDQPAITAGKRSSCSPPRSSGKRRATRWTSLPALRSPPASSLVVLIVLMFVGVRLVEAGELCLRLKWSGFELEDAMPGAVRDGPYPD